jgi:ABC-2 type transport system ATP-binding protein
VSTDASEFGKPGAAIEAEGLRKHFGRTVAVQDLDLSVPSEEIFGLVGPDGAGKTTTFRLLLALLIPDAGTVRIGGCDVRRQPQQARALTGYVAQAFTLYGDLTVAENLRFVAQVRNVERREFVESSRRLLELTGLAPFPDRLARDLSGGMKRKLALACALVHRPRILLLDEPTTGVDPVSRREFWRMLYGLPAEGVTLVVSTPYLDEAERCHRLGFMAGGRLLAVDTPRGLLGRMPDRLAEIRTGERTRTRRLLKQRPEVRRVETLGGSLRVAYDPASGEGDYCGALSEWLAGQHVPVESCEPVPATLSDVFSALSDVKAG